MFVRTGADTHARRSAILHAACRDETDSEANRYIPLSGSEALTSSRRRRQWQHDGSGIRDSDACSAWSSSKRMELRPGAGAAHLGQLAAHASRQKGSSLVDPCRAAFSRAAAEEMEMDGDGEQARASGRQDLGMQAAGLGLAVTAGSKTKKKVNFCNDGKVHHPRAGRGAKGGNIHRRTVPGMHGVFLAWISKNLLLLLKHRPVAANRLAERGPGRRGSQLAERRAGKSKAEAARDGMLSTSRRRTLPAACPHRSRATPSPAADPMHHGYHRLAS